METTKKGRPTENKKNTMLRVRIDDDTLIKLDKCATKKKTSRSEIVRNGIQQQYDQIKK